jgi:hypothetical protein
MKTVTQLIADIQDEISLPLTDEDRWNTTAVISALNNVMVQKVVPDILSYGSEYLVFRQVISLANYSNNIIPVPKRAYGRMLREIKYLPLGQTSQTSEVNIPQISMVNADSSQSINYPFYCYFRNDALHLHRQDNSGVDTGSVVLYFYLKPSTIVNTTTQFATITDVATSTTYTVITVPSVGAELNTYCSTSETKMFDVLRVSTGAIVAYNIPLERNTSTTFRFVSALLSPTEMANYQTGGLPVTTTLNTEELVLVPAGSCQYSTISEDFDQLLVYYTCSKILSSIGDVQSLEVNEQNIKDLKAHYANVFGSRLAGEPQKVVNRNGIGRMMNGYGWNNRWRRWENN